MFKSVNNEFANAWKTGIDDCEDVLRKSITFFHYFEDFFRLINSLFKLVFDNVRYRF